MEKNLQNQGPAPKPMICKIALKRPVSGIPTGKKLKEKNIYENQEMEQTLDATVNESPVKKRKSPKRRMVHSVKKGFFALSVTLGLQDLTIGALMKKNTTSKYLQCPHCDFACKFNFLIEEAC